MPDNARRFVSNIRQLLADDFDMDTSGVEFAAAEDLPAAVGDSENDLGVSEWSACLSPWGTPPGM